MLYDCTMGCRAAVPNGIMRSVKTTFPLSVLGFAALATSLAVGMPAMACRAEMSQTSGAAYAISSDAIPDIVVPSGMRPFVVRAAEDVASDLQKIFGKKPKIVIGATDAALAGRNTIVLEKSGEGWENYAVESMPSNVLRVVGSDDRGVMFGLYRFAGDCLGVDPFSYWSGVEPERRERMEFRDGISLHQGDPSFRFRGWFVNDEDFLNGFRPEENGRRLIAYDRYAVCFGPFLADKICESAVRAGFNLMVCASYVDILNPDEKRLLDVAASRGLYLTMHHQEPVGAGALSIDAHFPEARGTTYASHPDLWRKAWRAYIGEWAKMPDVIWMLGLRGRRDRPFWATIKSDGQWSDWGEESEAEDRRRAKLIAQAMDDQLGMIREAMCGSPFRTATQLWLEGADFFRKGYLDIPRGTTIVFADNCPGLKFQPDIGGVSRLPEGRGHGLYYHLAVVHGNHYCELVPPARTREVLADASKKGARELVLVNVSNVRPFVFTLEAAGRMTRSLAGFDAADFQHEWAVRNFGINAAPAVSRALDLYFAAYETELSRDAVSSYGSARERAPLAILNDGVMYIVLCGLVQRIRSPSPQKPVVSPYEVAPDTLAAVSGSAHDRVAQDMFPYLADGNRLAARALAQAAGFQRCLDQVELVDASLDGESRRRVLFERIGYPARFMWLLSRCCSELSLAASAREEGNLPAVRRHLASALSFSRERDTLDASYAAGKWAHWFDRNLVYPYQTMSDAIDETLRNLEKESCQGHFSKKGTKDT